jgi:hypothetical protein
MALSWPDAEISRKNGLRKNSFYCRALAGLCPMEGQVPFVGCRLSNSPNFGAKMRAKSGI